MLKDTQIFEDSKNGREHIEEGLRKLIGVEIKVSPDPKNEDIFLEARLNKTDSNVIDISAKDPFKISVIRVFGDQVYAIIQDHNKSSYLHGLLLENPGFGYRFVPPK